MGAPVTYVFDNSTTNSARRALRRIEEKGNFHADSVTTEPTDDELLGPGVDDDTFPGDRPMGA